MTYLLHSHQSILKILFKILYRFEENMQSIFLLIQVSLRYNFMIIFALVYSEASDFTFSALLSFRLACLFWSYICFINSV